MEDMTNSSAQDPALVETLRDLQAEIRRHREALTEMGLIERADPLADVRRHQWVNSHLPIGWPTMPRGLLSKLIAYAQKVTRRFLRWYLNPIVDQQNAYNAALSDVLQRYEGEFEALRRHRAQVDAMLGELGAAGARRDDALQGVSEQIAAERGHQEAEMEGLRLRVQRLENWRQGSLCRPDPPSAKVPEPACPAAGVDGFALGAQYRNERQMVARLGDYDDLLCELSQQQAELGGQVGSLLDIGAGRGEFVAHIQKLGLDAYGIEIDPDAVEIAQQEGRDVRLAEAFEHLAGLPDASLSAISLIQVAEHFCVDDLLQLLRLACAKLAPGGLLLAETVNPVCLWALANWYLLDPSHRTPLHPDLARFLLAQAGFEHLSVRYLHPLPEEAILQTPSPAEMEPALRALASSLQRNTERLNRFLYGPQDYAIIAYAPES